MATLSTDDRAWAVRNELAHLALKVHKAANEAGGDLDDALTALADVEVLVRNARKALPDLPATAKES
jgi:hypothetical protein